MVTFGYEGSPPHTWRIPRNIYRASVKTGITSTYVENTHFIVVFLGSAEDHLHIRGEYRLVILPIILHQGSPPHTWRIHCKRELVRRDKRITSTYVENTKRQSCCLALRQDHLHIRGEYLELQSKMINNLGSPPHTWRIPVAELKALLTCRITSTYVENT